MKNALCNSGCGLLIAVTGALLPVAVAHADSSDRMQGDQGGRQAYFYQTPDSTPTIQATSMSNLGPQGPIRSPDQSYDSSNRSWEDKNLDRSYDPDKTRTLMYGGS
jgi:hypothetical protein